MMSERNSFSDIVAAAFTLLWMYAAASKLSNFGLFQSSMANQVFGPISAQILAYLIPILELTIAGMLCLPKIRLIGLWCSAVLMAVFTGYIMLVMAGYFQKTPCSCGGVLDSLDWKSHLIFNLVWLLGAVAAIVYTRRKF